MGLVTHRVTKKGFRSSYISSSYPRLILARHQGAAPSPT
jgi:hypothetical protein